MDELNENDRERIKATFDAGSKAFSPEELKKVMDEKEKAQKKAPNLKEQFENFKLLWQLLQDYWKGFYPSAPWKFIAAIGFAIAYLIAPIDIIPDFLPVVGFVDDASVFALVMAAFSVDIDNYKNWKAQQPPANTVD